MVDPHGSKVTYSDNFFYGIMERILFGALGA